jgi:hypothetical protein
MQQHMPVHVSVTSQIGVDGREWIIRGVILLQGLWGLKMTYWLVICTIFPLCYSLWQNSQGLEICIENKSGAIGRQAAQKASDNMFPSSFQNGTSNSDTLRTSKKHQLPWEVEASSFPHNLFPPIHVRLSWIPQISRVDILHLVPNLDRWGLNMNWLKMTVMTVSELIEHWHRFCRVTSSVHKIHCHGWK